jgi:hypothetical protein
MFFRHRFECASDPFQKKKKEKTIPLFILLFFALLCPLYIFFELRHTSLARCNDNQSMQAATKYIH